MIWAKAMSCRPMIGMRTFALQPSAHGTAKAPRHG